jgi:type VI secretion system secreted protein VgrG
MGIDGEEHVMGVAYLFVSDVLTERVEVTAFEATEAIDRPYEVRVHLQALAENTDFHLLLGRDAEIQIHRDIKIRRFPGIVDRIEILDDGRLVQTARLHLRPALHALSRTVRSRIFQEKTALAIVEEVLGEGLTPYGRSFESATLDRGGFVQRDYCVQYRESDLDFCRRLLSEEGISFTFRFDAPEVLVLFEGEERSQGREAPIDYARRVQDWTGPERIVSLTSSHQRTPTRVKVQEWDWTRVVRRTASHEKPLVADDGGRSHPVVHHDDSTHLLVHEEAEAFAAAVALLGQNLIPDGLPAGIEHRVFDLPGAVVDAFTESMLARETVLSGERLVQDARTFEGVGTVPELVAGTTFDLVGHVTLGLDGRYLLTEITHRSAGVEPLATGGMVQGTGGARGSAAYRCDFQCVPAATAWRPRRVPKPRIHGVQTAEVSGPPGSDVHTDPFGRISLHFHWDPEPVPPSGKTSCWVRVSQPWAGAGKPGFLFLPRVGMEVVVSFIDGDPDQPLVTGCVYNGAHPTPDFLPLQATKSVLRTRTVPHGDGYNELSFEDAAGRERVHLRAQRDLDERILRNHDTDVGGNQSTHISGDRIEEVEHHQRTLIRGRRDTVVRGRESHSALSDYQLSCGGSVLLQASENLDFEAEGGTVTFHVEHGEFEVESKGDIGLLRGEDERFEMLADGEEKGILLDASGAKIHLSEDEIVLQVGDSSISITSERVQINGKVMPGVAGSGQPPEPY